MTRSQSNSDTRGLNVENTFLNLEAQLRGKQAITEAESSVLTALCKVLLARNQQAAATYRAIARYVMARNSSEAQEAIDQWRNFRDAGFPEVAKQIDLHALRSDLVRILRREGISSSKIADVIDDGWGDSIARRRDRARKRDARLDSRGPAGKWWNSMFVNWISGTPKSDGMVATSGHKLRPDEQATATRGVVADRRGRERDADHDLGRPLLDTNGKATSRSTGSTAACAPVRHGSSSSLKPGKTTTARLAAGVSARTPPRSRRVPSKAS